MPVYAPGAAPEPATACGDAGAGSGRWAGERVYVRGARVVLLPARLGFAAPPACVHALLLLGARARTQRERRPDRAGAANSSSWWRLCGSTPPCLPLLTCLHLEEQLDAVQGRRQGARDRARDAARGKHFRAVPPGPLLLLGLLPLLPLLHPLLLIAAAAIEYVVAARQPVARREGPRQVVLMARCCRRSA